MASLITLSNNFIFSSPSAPKTPTRPQHPFCLVLFKDIFSERFPNLGISCFFRSRRGRVSSACKASGSEGDPDLEAKVLEFMKNSKNPNSFPTKEELFEAGRIDLLKSIAKHGGWMSLGWGLDDEEEEEEGGVPISDVDNRIGSEVSGVLLRIDSRIVQDRLHDGGRGGIDYVEGIEARHDSFLLTSSSCSPSSSGRMESEEGVGIAGILNRLEKQRNKSYGFDSRDKESEVYGSWNDDKEQLKSKISEVLENGNIQCMYNSDESWNSPTPDLWRKWSNKRAGISKGEFEAAEFGGVNRNDETVTDTSSGDKEKVNDYSWLRSRLQNMELELDSALKLLHCNTDLAVSDKESLSLSDAREFRETEIMKARDKLRSLRAQFAVLEGQMTLKIIEAQKMIGIKQKKIDAAQKALHSLRTACVIWHKPASEVLLVGSFDGWTNQRRMELSSPGIFTLYLKLYPGQYEIKFIVDGMWMIDPLRPVVNNNGHQNNLLIIS